LQVADYAWVRPVVLSRWLRHPELKLWTIHPLGLQIPLLQTLSSCERTPYCWESGLQLQRSSGRIRVKGKKAVEAGFRRKEFPETDPLFYGAKLRSTQRFVYLATIGEAVCPYQLNTENAEKQSRQLSQNWKGRRAQGRGPSVADGLPRMALGQTANCLKGS